MFMNRNYWLMRIPLPLRLSVPVTAPPWGLLTSADAFSAFKDSLTSDPQLTVDVQREKAYYAAQSAGLTKTITIVGTTVAVIMAIGAMFGAPEHHVFGGGRPRVGNRNFACHWLRCAPRAAGAS